MAQQAPILKVVLAPAAVEQLSDLWRWNAARYSAEHADEYLRFVKEVVFGLGRNYQNGKQVQVRPELRYVLIRRRSGGHGHIVVYRLNESAVEVLHVFHSAQDWQTRLKESPST